MLASSHSVTGVHLHRSLSRLTHTSTNSTARSSRVLALRQSCDFRLPSSLPIHLPASLCSTLVRRFPAPTEAQSPVCLSPSAAAGIPDSQHLNLPVVLSPTTPCLPMSAFSMLASHSRSGVVCRRAVSRLRPPAFLGFANQTQARQDIRPNRVSFVRTDRLAFRCSPPRLTTTQLRSAFNQSSIWLRVFSPPLQVRSRAHARGRPAPRLSQDPAKCGALYPASHGTGSFSVRSCGVEVRHQNPRRVVGSVPGRLAPGKGARPASAPS